MNKINRKNHLLPIILYLLLQVAIFNSLLIADKYCIYIYVYVLFMYHTSKPIYNLFRAFVVGLIIDIFSNTICIHASACVFVVYLINMVIYFRVGGQDEFNELGSYPLSIKNIGLKNFIFLYFILILAHQTILFLVDNWTNRFSFGLAKKIVISTCFTFSAIFIIGIVNFIYQRRKDLA